MRDGAWFVAPFDGRTSVGVFGGSPSDFTLPFVKLAGMFVARESVMLLGVILVNVSALEPLPYANRTFNKVPDPIFNPWDGSNHEMLTEPFALAVAGGVENRLPDAG